MSSNIITIIKIVLLLALIIFTFWGFSSSYSSHNIDNIVHVVAIGIDKSDNEQHNMKVSFQFLKNSTLGESSSSETSSIVTSINANTFNHAISLMNSYIGKELNFSHCKVIVFSKDFATDGISTEIYNMMNNEQIRPSTNIVISTSKANTYLKNSNPNIEKLVTNYYDTFELTSNFTGYSTDTTLGTFYSKLICSDCNNTAILGRTFETSSDSENSSDKSESQNNKNSNNSSESSNSEKSNSESESKAGQSSNDGSNSENNEASSLDILGERGTQNIGIAVFREDKYIGQLSDTESICHMLVTNNIDSCTIAVPIEEYPDNTLDIRIINYKNNVIKIDTSSDEPHISITLHYNAKILDIREDIDYSDPSVIDEISNKVESYLKEQIDSYLIKTSREFKSDIVGFNKYAKSNFLTINEWKNYNWGSKYENANFSVNVAINTNSRLLFTKR